MRGQARRSGLVMGLDTHMIAGSRACSTSTRLTHPIITNETTPHFAEALGFPRQAVAGGLLFWRGRRLRGALDATAVDPGLRPRFFSVLPTLCNFRSR